MGENKTEIRICVRVLDHAIHKILLKVSLNATPLLNIPLKMFARF